MTMLRFFVFSVLAVMADAACSSVKCEPDSGKKPHIVFFVADDLGWNDISWNNPDIITPNLQSLAHTGLILNQSYVQALCSASRAALLTGLYPYHNGFQSGVVKAGQPSYVPLEYTLLPEKLKEQGYKTHLVGKWHLGNCRIEATPNRRGFDYFFGPYTGIVDFWTKKMPLHPVPGVNITEVEAYDLRENYDIYYSPVTEYATDLFVDKAIEQIEALPEDTPMFMTVMFTTPHYPLQVPDSYLEYYPNVADKDRQAFLAMVTSMDESVGKVVQALKDKGIYEDTIIVFTSDNGAVPAGGGGSAYPLRDFKGSYYEGGTRSPTMIHSRKFLCDPGRVSNDLFHIVDWFPTFLKAAGGTPADGLDGIDQWDMLTKGSKGTRDEFVYNIALDNLSGDPIYAARFKKYKLIEGDAKSFIPDPAGPRTPAAAMAGTCETPPVCDCELYDIEADPSESRDLVCEKPILVERLYKKLKKMKKSIVPSAIDFYGPKVEASAPEYHNGTISYGWC